MRAFFVFSTRSLDWDCTGSFALEIEGLISLQHSQQRPGWDVLRTKMRKGSRANFKVIGPFLFLMLLVDRNAPSSVIISAGAAQDDLRVGDGPKSHLSLLGHAIVRT